MNFTVENVCGLLIGSKLLAPEEVKTIYQRWQSEAGDAATDLTQFTRWLVVNQYVTEYQAALVAKGHSDGFFIHQYKILERLGKGRMAGVYKAVHQLGQVVAIKVLPPSRGKDPQMLARFQREAKLAIRLKHPNVVRSFQVGKFRGLHYFVMEYLEGETLEAVLTRRKKLMPPEAVRLAHQLLHGIEHVHEQGLVHRDVKPANLMLTPLPPKNETDTTLHATLKLLDIGLGRALGDPSRSGEGLTSMSDLLGTPDYLAPEQARDPRSIDIRADIYSAGCVLYHMLAGQPPFPDTNVLSQMVRHASEPPKPLREFVAGMSEGLQQVVSMMLAKDPNQRFPTPERAARALQAYVAAGGAPSRLSEEGPQLKKYLTWLETAPQPRESGDPPVAVPVAEPLRARPVKPGRVTAPVATPVAPPAASAVAVAPAPAAPAPPAPAPRPEKPRSEFDVELLQVAAPAAVPPRGLWPIANRDWFFLALGAGAVILAGTVGFALAWLLRLS
jgi:serine/threonine protein kinase